jgi:hypothetical protein
MPDMVKDWIELATEKLNEISGHKLLDVSFNGDDLVFTKSNGGTITLAGVKDAFVQELSFNKETSELTISSGNMVSLNRGLTEEQYAHLSEIMARPYGSWVLNTGPVYSQTHPSRDVDGRKSCRVEWGLGIIHLDFVAAAKSGVIGSIPNTPDDPGPKAEILIEVQLRDGSTVWIDENDRTIKGQAMTVGERYLINLIGFFVH